MKRKTRLKTCMVMLLSVVMMLSLSATVFATEGTGDSSSASSVSQVDAVAQIGEDENAQYFPSLKEAVAAAEKTNFSTKQAPENPTTIKLLKDTNDGIDIGKSGSELQNIILDLNEHTLTLGPAIGSTNTETNGLRVLSYSKIEIKNGTITNSNVKNDKGGYVLFLLVNYGTMKLTDVSVTPAYQAQLAVNNRGALTLAGKTTINNPKNKVAGWSEVIAITNDVYNAHYTDFDASLTVESSDVTVGNIMTERYEGNRNGNEGSVVVNISGGNYGTIYSDGGTGVSLEGNIIGGTFDSIPELEYCTDGYIPVKAADDGKYTVEGGNYQVAILNDDGTYTGYTDQLSSVLYDKAKDGQTVVLLRDWDYSAYKPTIKTSITLDLNGHTLQGSNSKNPTALIEKSSTSRITVTVKNGSIISMYSDALRIGRNAAVTLENVILKGKTYGITAGNYSVMSQPSVTISGADTNIYGETAGIAVYSKGESTEGTQLTIKDGIISGGYGISGNGTTTYSNENMNITVEGGTIRSTSDNAPAIYHPHVGTLTVTGGTIEGATGIEMRAGTLNVLDAEDGTSPVIKGTAGNLSVSANGSGSTTIGAGIAVAQHTTKLPVTVNISGGNISGAVALNESNPQKNDPEDIAKVEITISGGTFIGNGDSRTAVSSADCKDFISGGTFSNDVTEYCQKTKIAKEKGENTYIVGSLTEEEAVASVKNENGKAVFCRDLDFALETAEDGDTVMLLKDVTYSSDIVIDSGERIIIDLNNHNIKFSKGKYCKVKHGQLDIIGEGTIYEEVPYYSAIQVWGSNNPEDENYSVVNVGKDVTLEGYNGLSVEANNETAYGVAVNIAGTLNGKADAGGYGAVALNVNGKITGMEGNIPIITVEKTAKLNGEKGESSDINNAASFGIYLAGYANTIIEDSAVIEGSTGVEIRAGKLTVNGGKITGNEKPLDSQGNGNGPTTTGAGISVAQHTTKLPIELIVNGGTITGYTALYEGNPQGNSDEDIAKVKMSVIGGEFESINDGTAAIYSDDCTKFIKTTDSTTVISSTKIDKKYCADGFIPVGLADSQGKYTVVPAVAKIGDKEYDSLESAVKDAVTGDNIILLIDYTIQEDSLITIKDGVTLTISDNVTLSNSGKIDVYGEITGESNIKNSDNGKLNHHIKSLSVDSTVALVVGETHKLTVTKTPVDAVEDVAWFSSNPDIVTVDENGNIKAEAASTDTVTITVKAGEQTATCTVTVSKKSAPAAPTDIAGVNETVKGNFDGKITGVTGAMEYRVKDSAEWIKCTGSEIAGLAPGTYEIRVAETDTTEAGYSTTVEIKTGAAPTYTLNVSAPTFAAVKYGYDAPEAKAITISSTGNSDAKITNVTVSDVDGESVFEISGNDKTVSAGDSIDTWTIQPKSGLDAGTYEATITVAYNDGAKATATISFTVSKASQSTPTVAAVKDRTYTSITLEPIADNESGAAAQYSIDGGQTWQDSNVFENLLPGIEYSFTVRYAAVDGKYTASAASEATAISTKIGTNENTVTPDDKDALTEEKQELEKALKSDAYTDEEKAMLNDRSGEIDAAFTALENAEKASDLIEALPNADAVTKDDADDINAAKAAYDKLTDHEKILVGDEAKAKLDAAIKALAALNDDEEAVNPGSEKDDDSVIVSDASKTGDDMNLIMWLIVALTAVLLGGITIIFRRKNFNK